MNIETFLNELKLRGLDVNAKQREQFHIYFKTLVEWNEKMNLTAITEEEEVYAKHFFDSISAGFYFDFNRPLRVCDVGAGAGFPSLPLKIMFPELKVTIVDSLQKRITFLNHLANQLGLEEVAFYHDRAELFGRNERFRESFDVVMARAVARLSVLSELCLPLVKKPGAFIAMKGPSISQEIEESQSALELLGGKLEKVETFQLPEENGERNIAIIQKTKKTPKKFPRKPGVPNKQPL
ncbi:16S rRNA (guanine(527)-N(7))-methyltransferase RsmG [Radiobacillus deserti]|uniref:Ribosomal RNA small subunit methyltransferase G n=1 Tax=Radiobacillus deserti TaxID=2594883 RepID=A0A516KKV8_9BACI|nr:16S rRNA (guanine(527)-N(7))-methyltransferase RsmG [Radiobacillus deserti]QDP42022.1 16S rRNA (guanine(527)-N(7))-methyltransferase RsmG [Radiobacillus deserti]